MALSARYDAVASANPVQNGLVDGRLLHLGSEIPETWRRRHRRRPCVSCVPIRSSRNERGRWESPEQMVHLSNVYRCLTEQTSDLASRCGTLGCNRVGRRDHWDYLLRSHVSGTDLTIR